MSNRNLTILGIVAAMMVMWAVVQYRAAHEPPPLPTAPAALIQGLNPADIDKIVLGAGKEAATIVRQENQFVLADKDNYPAENKQINYLISAVLDIKTSQLITSNAANHEDLELTEAKSKQIVKFYDKSGKLLAGVIVGKQDEQRGGKFVRRVDEDNVYLCTEAPFIQTGVLDYVDKKILDVNAEDIVDMTVRSDAGSYTIKNDEKNKPILQNIPEGKKQNDSQVQQVIGGMNYISLNDVKKSAEGLNFDHTIVCNTKNSNAYTIKVAAKDNKYYVAVSVENTDTTKVIKEDRKESEDELKKKEAILLTRENALKLKKRHEGWVYEIPEWKGKSLVKTFVELIEDQPKPQADAQATPSTDGGMPTPETSAAEGASAAAPGAEKPAAEGASPVAAPAPAEKPADGTPTSSDSPKAP